MKTNRKLLAAAGVMVVLVLAGCWGGGGNDEAVDPGPPTASNDVPDGAGVGTASFIAFLAGLSGRDETSEPLTFKSGFAVPDDEAAEPIPLT